MEQMRNIHSDIPAGMTAAEYRRLVNRPPRRHSAIRRFASFGIVR